jgi:catechol 2,3-dioxygenase-like lactoylglutathione lyase family enzyme
MLSHVYIGIADFERCFAFYAAVLDTLGLELKFREDDWPWAGWMTPAVPRPLFIIGRAFDGGPVTPGNGQMVALLAASRGIVERCYLTALAHGASCEGPPGLRPRYHAHYYGAYFRDLEGNKLCVCCHEPPA